MTLIERLLNAENVVKCSKDVTTVIVWNHLADIYWKKLLKQRKANEQQ